MSNALDKLKVSNNTFRSRYSDQFDIYNRVSKLEVTSGYSINELIDLFAAGYTLQSPDYNEQMADLGEIVDKLNAVGMVNACSAEDIRAALEIASKED